MDVAYFLGAEFKPLESAGQAIAETVSTQTVGTVAFPFYLGNGLFVTIHDLDEEGRFTFKEAPVQFGDFYATKQALLSSAYWAHVLETHTAILLREGADLRTASAIDPKLAWSFSERVCVWGGRAGVAVKLKRRAQENPAIEKQFLTWLKNASQSDDLTALMAEGVAIPEVGVSFASKHLRFIDPTQHATFDALLAQVVGMELNPEYYAEFVGLLDGIREQHQLVDDVATLEMGFFALIRFFVDANALSITGNKLATEPPEFASVSPAALEREFIKLDEFSPSITLYRRKNLPHIYGFSKLIEQRHAKDLPRYPMVLMLALREGDARGLMVYQPDMFSVNHGALRTEHALDYLTWWMYNRHRLYVVPFSQGHWDEHPFL